MCNSLISCCVCVCETETIKNQTTTNGVGRFLHFLTITLKWNTCKTLEFKDAIQMTVKIVL